MNFLLQIRVRRCRYDHQIFPSRFHSLLILLLLLLLLSTLIEVILLIKLVNLESFWKLDFFETLSGVLSNVLLLLVKLGE